MLAGVVSVGADFSVVALRSGASSSAVAEGTGVNFAAAELTSAAVIKPDALGTGVNV